MDILKIKWSVSRGQNSYGYNICSLWKNGEKVTSTNGGGYDMVGTVLANYLVANYQDRLLKLDIPMNRRNGEDIQEIYGLSFSDGKGKHQSTHFDGETEAHFDGAVGVSEVLKLAKNIGLDIVWNEDIFVITDRKEQTI